MKISIITPTIGRVSLKYSITSVIKQSYNNWEYLIYIDTKDIEDVINLIRSFNDDRIIYKYGEVYNNYGNTPRYLLYEYATGDLIMYLDDDCWYKDSKVFLDVVNFFKQTNKDVIFFPNLRMRRGNLKECYYFQRLKNGIKNVNKGMVETHQIVYKRIMPDGNMIKWPNVKEYCIEYLLANELLKYNYMVNNDRPLVVKTPEVKGKLDIDRRYIKFFEEMFK